MIYAQRNTDFISNLTQTGMLVYTTKLDCNASQNSELVHKECPTAVCYYMTKAPAHIHLPPLCFLDFSAY